MQLQSPDLKHWFESAEATFEFGDISSDLDGDAEYSYDDYMSSIQSDGLSIQDDVSDRTDSMKDYIRAPVINPDFYHQPPEMQVAIYAADVVKLQDRNQILSKKVQRLTDSHRKHKKQAEMQNFEIKRITSERDSALSSKFTLEKRVEDLIAETARIRKQLTDQRRRREKEVEAEKNAIEESLLATKFELAKCAEKYDNLEFNVYQMRQENVKLKQLAKTQTEQLHHLGMILCRSGVKISSFESESADLKFAKQRYKQTLESKI